MFVNVQRDNAPPIFRNEPYGTVISENRLNEVIYTAVTATDSDLAVSLWLGSLLVQAIKVFVSYSSWTFTL